MRRCDSSAVYFQFDKMKFTRRQFVRIAFAIALVFISIALYSYFIEPRRLVVNTYEMAIDGWDPEFDGFRAVLISDVHGGSNGGDAEKLRQIVKTVNEQNADAVFLLGDFVSTTRDRRSVLMQPSAIADALAGLQAGYGAFAVLGNHDGWFGDEAVATELERVGIRVLNGEMAFIERNGRRIRLLGMKDHFKVETWKKTSEDSKALIAASEGTGNIIALEHSPDVLHMIAGDLSISSELKIMFAGHTHGGQLWLPLLGHPFVPSSFGQKYAAGHIKDLGIDMFVTTGTGTSVVPFRFLVPPEIAVVTIRSD